jgi:hypothetical protein
MNLLNRSSRSDVTIGQESPSTKETGPDGNICIRESATETISLFVSAEGKNEKSVIISTVSDEVIYRSGKPHLVQGMHGGMELWNCSYHHFCCRLDR